MTRACIHTGVVILALAMAHPRAETRPDFSGSWVLTDRSPGTVRFCSKSLTAAQRADALTLDRRAIRFDGTDTREALSDPAARPDGLPPGVWHATTVAAVSRAAWNGNQLVVVTHRTMKVTWTKTPTEFEWQQTFREALSLDANGHLVVDRAVIVDPLPGGSPTRLDLPTAWTCTYTKAG